jgi:uncharacterized protein (UPF0212 family)
MKKIVLLVAVAGLAMASCKKDRTCTCTSTPVSQTVNGVTQTISTTPTTTDSKYTKVEKGAVDCSSGDETVSGSYIVGNTTYAVVQVNKVECELK